MSDRLGDLFWNDAKSRLRGVGLEWWKENRESLAQLGREEADEIFQELRAGRTDEAKLAIVSHMSREEWKAYMRKTTQALESVAARRAKLLDGLGDLGSKAAKSVGEAALAAMRAPR